MCRRSVGNLVRLFCALCYRLSSCYVGHRANSPTLLSHLASRKVEAPVPQYLPQVEPWGRYKEFGLVLKNNYKGRDLFEKEHPLAVRELAIFEHNAKIVDQGALLKKKVTRPAAALLTWPKRFECSAFWGMMKLLEIDGKSAPGEKALDKSASSSADPTPEPAAPKHNIAEVRDMAKQKSFRLRESIVLQAMNGPAPAGIKDPKDRGGMDSLIFQAANRGKLRSTKDDKNDEEEAASPPPVVSPRRTSVKKRESMLTMQDMSAINNLTAQLSKTAVAAPPLAFSGGSDPLFELRAQTVKYEKEAIRAKMNVAEKEVAAAEAQQEVAAAKLASAKTEVAMMRKVMEAYDKAEASLEGMK